MNRDDAIFYAHQWIERWCARDIDALVEHYAEDVQFMSPLAAKRTGSPSVHGRHALLAYWNGAHAYDSFSFVLNEIIWDEDARKLVVIYTRHVNERIQRACEFFTFDVSGEVTAGEAMYGADVVAL